MADKRIDPAGLDLIKYPDPRLRKKSVEIREFDDWLKQVARRMFEVMYASRGVGLAAPQVGLNIRMFVCNPHGQPSEGGELVLVNPVLSDLDGAAENEEGCLSLPGVYGPVLRAARCRVQARDVAGAAIDLRGVDFLSRIFQHETDHLDGVLHIDRFGSAARMAVRRLLRELEEQYQGGARKRTALR